MTRTLDLEDHTAEIDIWVADAVGDFADVGLDDIIHEIAKNYITTTPMSAEIQRELCAMYGVEL